jgi:hypothetical protein
VEYAPPRFRTSVRELLLRGFLLRVHGDEEQCQRVEWRGKESATCGLTLLVLIQNRDQLNIRYELVQISTIKVATIVPRLVLLSGILSPVFRVSPKPALFQAFWLRFSCSTKPCASSTKIHTTSRSMSLAQSLSRGEFKSGNRLSSAAAGSHISRCRARSPGFRSLSGQSSSMDEEYMKSQKVGSNRRGSIEFFRNTLA